MSVSGNLMVETPNEKQTTSKTRWFAAANSFPLQLPPTCEGQRTRAMLALMALSSIAALLFVYIFMPALWASIMAVDEALDAHEAGLAVVASRMCNIPASSGLPSHSIIQGTRFVKRARRRTWRS
ncbi:hypothetical protein HYPSUDRAFT_38657 [Hypholoma sublateritium FD-334 SS-4]|uniref:Uncharacterized protein n=1 Tax=Hypholoma sublateritium (strain FD-334 SS-4) TaxID=945553 RepID=A0A0D2PZ13_HYPSF|nr:hypothetical protein HYPSUDRAFT_38657 [Hypholoma sublateritium FD-334 SS-4]